MLAALERGAEQFGLGLGDGRAKQAAGELGGSLAFAVAATFPEEDAALADIGMPRLERGVRLIQHVPERVAKADLAIAVEDADGIRQNADRITPQKFLALRGDAQRHRALVLGGTSLLDISQAL